VRQAISGTSGCRSSTPMVVFDSQGNDFLLGFDSDLRSRWNRCRFIVSQQNGNPMERERERERERANKKQNVVVYLWSHLRYAVRGSVKLSTIVGVGPRMRPCQHHKLTFESSVKRSYNVAISALPVTTTKLINQSINHKFI